MTRKEGHAEVAGEGTPDHGVEVGAGGERAPPTKPRVGSGWSLPELPELPYWMTRPAKTRRSGRGRAVYLADVALICIEAWQHLMLMERRRDDAARLESIILAIDEMRSGVGRRPIKPHARDVRRANIRERTYARADV